LRADLNHIAVLAAATIRSTAASNSRSALGGALSCLLALGVERCEPDVGVRLQRCREIVLRRGAREADRGSVALRKLDRRRAFATAVPIVAPGPAPSRTLRAVAATSSRCACSRAVWAAATSSCAARWRARSSTASLSSVSIVSGRRIAGTRSIATRATVSAKARRG
jgi:hypothetical protein